MAADDVDEKFDGSEPAIPSVSEANAELRRVAEQRSQEAFAKAEKVLHDIREEFIRLDARVSHAIVELGNWLGLLRELKERK